MPMPEAHAEDSDYKDDTWTQEVRPLVAGLDRNAVGNYPRVQVILQIAKTEGIVSVYCRCISPCQGKPVRIQALAFRSP